MKRLLLLFLLLGFTSSSWADPEKPSGNLLDLDPVEDNLPSQGDYEFIDLYNYSNFDKNQEKKKSVNTKGNRPDFKNNSDVRPDNIDFIKGMEIDIQDGQLDGKVSGSVLNELNQGKKQSINQGQIRKNGWQQKPTSIKKKPLNFKRK